MSEEALSEEVRDFLLRHIGSVTHLETLLFLRAHPGAGWDARSLARRLYARDSETAAALAELNKDGFVALEAGFYRYAAPAYRHAVIEAVATAYAHQLIAITNLVHHKRQGTAAAPAASSGEGTARR